MKRTLPKLLKQSLVLLLLLALACTVRELPGEQTAASAVPEATEAPTEEPVVVIEQPAKTPEPTLPPAPSFTPKPTPTPVPTEVPPHAPDLVLVCGDEIEVDASLDFFDPGVIATDYRGMNLTGRVESSGEVVPYLVGDYTITYRVSDDYGFTTTAVRTVHVVPVEMPEIVMPPEKTVYLTFDDGPCGNTNNLLDVLKKYDVKATFFVVGEMGRPEVIKRAYEEGHAIGVHCYVHDKKIYKSEQAYFEDFMKMQEVIREQTGSYTRIFRFPGGSANTSSRFNKGIMTRLTKIMTDMGYRYFDWNISAGDSGEAHETSFYENRIISGLKRNTEYVIVLQHDIKPNSVRAVEGVIKWGLKNGYTFLPLDITSPHVESKVNN